MIDDAEEASNGSVDLGSTDLEMVAESTDQIVGLRFLSVPVPQGVVITRAYITFQTDSDAGQGGSGDTDLVIQGELIGDAPGFSGTSQNISNRTRTTQQVEWNDIPAWNTADELHNTVDISSVIQEIVGQTAASPGGAWASGNDMVIIITGSGKRSAESKNGGGTTTLHIEYSEDPVPFITVDPGQLGASHYVGGNAPVATFTITNSGSAAMNSYTVSDNADWISLDVAGGSLAAGASDTITVTYATTTLAEGTHEATITVTHADAPNSPVEIDVSVTVLSLPPSTTCGHVPVYTENLVSPAILVLLDVSSSMTSLMDVSSGGGNPQTPDLSAIVQEIIGQAGWASGNRHGFPDYREPATGPRKRSMGIQGAAPLLHVEYTDGGNSTEHRCEGIFL